jgi:2C-methyl-D-erythritol 2,4-cyclodiphosphate synthase
MARSLELEDSIADTLQRRGQFAQKESKTTVAGLGSKQHIPSRTAAKRLSEVCNVVAAEMQETGQTVVNIANTIAAESQALAELLHKHGTAIEARIEQFMSMSDRVRVKMREAHDDLLGTSGSGPSLAPRAHDEG